MGKISINKMTHRVVVSAAMRGFMFVNFDGEFKGHKSRLKIKCNRHGIFNISHHHFTVRLQGCPYCASNTKLDKHKALNKILELCKGTKYEFVRWREDLDKNRFEIICTEHGLRIASYYDFVIKGKRCKSCAGKEKYTKFEASTLILEKYKSTPFIFLGFENDEYEGRDTKLSMFCPTHGEWSLSFTNAISRFSKCPSCAHGGFAQNKSAYLYVLINENKDALKVGISNNCKMRFRDLKRCTPFDFNVIKVIRFEKGADAFHKEQEIHKNFEHCNFSGFSGHTEWLKYTDDLMNTLDEMDRLSPK